MGCQKVGFGCHFATARANDFCFRPSCVSKRGQKDLASSTFFCLTSFCPYSLSADKLVVFQLNIIVQRRIGRGLVGEGCQNLAPHGRASPHEHTFIVLIRRAIAEA